MALSKIDSVALGANAVANSIGYQPMGNTSGSISTALGYTPMGNSSGSVTGALGFTPANKAGDTITGAMTFSNTVSVTGNTTITGKLTANNIAMDTAFSHRNILINGNFDIWQRATSGNHTGIWSYVSADRWGGHFDGGTVGTYSRSTDVPNALSTYSMKVTGNTGGTAAYLDQRIEAANGRAALKAGAVTISGWVKRSGSASATISLNLITPTAVDNFTSYDTTGACFTQNNTITGNGTASGSQLTLTSADTWYYFTMTDTSWATRNYIANGAQIYFALGGLSSTSNYYLFSQLQMEAGTVATPFELRSSQTELAMCQRYYEKSHDQATAPADGAASPWMASSTPNAIYSQLVQFKVSKRTAPTVVCYNDGNGTTPGCWHYYTGSGWSSIGGNTSGARETGFRVAGASGTYGYGYLISGGWAASAEL